MQQRAGEGPGPRRETVKRDRHRNLLFTVGLSQIPSSALWHARRLRERERRRDAASARVSRDAATAEPTVLPDPLPGVVENFPAAIYRVYLSRPKFARV